MVVTELLLGLPLLLWRKEQDSKLTVRNEKIVKTEEEVNFLGEGERSLTKVSHEAAWRDPRICDIKFKVMKPGSLNGCFLL